ncbi:hypothetical protein [Nocardia sp. XZ_19_385]|uniref:LppU/SCO3897 family protein n=1 Tax=Nocardia sp. XZ_19_385 TaxID=2769488 RepID=UPI00188E13BA|nr:hypothetical protein [Nocardia sp. XZ_19_385]
MHDQSDLPTAPAEPGDPVTTYPLPPAPMVPFQAPPVPAKSRRRWLVPLVVFVVTVLAAAGTVTGYFLTRPEPLKWAVGDCVSLTTPTVPTEYGCADPTGATYRIASREDVVWPLDMACTKYPDVTKAVAEPVGTGAEPTTVLCLTPTRNNKSDPGAVAVGDCVDVKGAGDSITRGTCDVNGSATRVIATELHNKVPVVDQACRAHPTARQAFAQASLGGRAIVLCTVPVNPSDFANAQVGSCVNGHTRGLTDCAGPDAKYRVLTVRTLFHRPERPQCLDAPSSIGFSMNSSEKVDFVLALCMGPVENDHALYSNVGECLTQSASAGSGAGARRVDCADPTADSEVIARMVEPDGACPGGWTSKITWDAEITNGMTVCLRRR